MVGGEILWITLQKGTIGLVSINTQFIVKRGQSFLIKGYFHMSQTDFGSFKCNGMLPGQL